MRNLVLVAGAIVALAGFADSASARCADDLKAAKTAAADIPLSRKTGREALTQKLDEAAIALSKRDEHGCKAAVAAAQAMMK